MTVISPDPTRSRRTLAAHAYRIPVVRELPALSKPGLAPGPAW